MKKFKLALSESTLRRTVKAEVSHSLNEIRNQSINLESLIVESPWLQTSEQLSFENFGNITLPLNTSLDCGALHDDSCRFESLSDHFDSSSDSADDNPECGDCLRSELAAWAAQFNVSLSAQSALLKILNPHLPSLPTDARSLVHIDRKVNVRPLQNGGEYCHLGIAKSLAQCLYLVDISSTDTLELQLNIDGLPLFKSSSTCLWPILCLVKNCSKREPFVVGLYCGTNKPASAEDFLSDFVSEAIDLLKNGLLIGSKHYSVVIHSFVCDAPARAFVKGVKHHSGYSSCEKCTQHGEYVGKVIFPCTGAAARTDKDFAEMKDRKHHVGICPLNSLGIGCVSQFGLDYMHLVCLGIVRRLLLYWKGPDGPLHVRLGRKLVLVLSDRLLSLAKHIPKEFARKPRSLHEVLRWKATEFRQFLLYTGVVVLQGVLSAELYQHFLLLSVAISILVSNDLAKEHCSYAEELLTKFVKDAAVLYGNEILVYNVHCLLHLAADVKVLGALDEFSAFPFENALGHLKKLVRKPQFPIQQVVLRLNERYAARLVLQNVVYPVTKFEHCAGPVPACMPNVEQFRQVQTDKYMLSLNCSNNCVIVSCGVDTECIPVRVKNIMKIGDKIILLCTKFTQLTDFFTSPVSSTCLNFYKVAGESADFYQFNLSDVLYKCVCLPLCTEKSSFVVLPMRH